MKVLITVIFVLFIVEIDCINCSSSCFSGCSCCSSNDTCFNCNGGYYLNPYAVNDTTTAPDPSNASILITTITTRMAANCLPCSDSSCTSCSISPSGKEQCSACQPYYGINRYNTTQCLFCSEFNAWNCKLGNDCQAANNCSECDSFDYDNSLNMCLSCWQRYRYCYSCNKTVCTGCMSGFFLNTTNNQECVECIFPNCFSCTDGPRCTSCISGFFLSNWKCYPCLYPCLSCSINICYSCNTTGNLYVLFNRTCVPCSNISILGKCSACLQATATLYNCTQCATGSFINNSICLLCSPPCLACNNSSVCLSCNASLSFLTVNKTCALCSTAMPNCQTCLNQSICLNCSYGFVVAYETDIGTCVACDRFHDNCENCTISKCLICKLGSSMVNSICQINLNCTSNCLSCETGFPAKCVACSPRLYLQFRNKTCMPCPDTCTTCSYSNCTGCNTTVACLSCPQGAYLNGSTCLPCTSSSYYLDTISSCLPCPSYCTACTVAGCTACESPLFALSPLGRCQDICGDGFAVTLPCDSGFKQNDGCADDCSIQSGYNCTKSSIANPYPSSNATVRTSQCSFFGQTTASLSKVSQSLLSNRLQIDFQILPYLYGLPTGYESQSYLRSIFQLAPLDRTAEYTISVDPSSQTVSFDISYALDISKYRLNLAINYALLSSLPMFRYMSNQSLAFAMDSIIATGRLGAFHNESEYTSNKAMFAASACVAGLGYLLLMLGLFARELAGLQHMLLCQTVFLLLLFGKPSNNFYVEGLLGLKYSAGIDIFGSQAKSLSSGQAYLYGINTESFASNFNINFLLLVVPILVSPIFMLYRIKNKHLPVKKDFGKSAAEILIGEIPLYFAVFNFYGLVSYAYLYFHSSQEQQMLNVVLMLVSGILTVFSWSHLVFRPEVVGCFRSVFSSYKTYLHFDPPRSQLTRRLEDCITWRFNLENWREHYRFLSINFYFVLLVYQIAAVYVIINSFNLILAILQAVVLLLLFLLKPYLKTIEKFRSMFAFLILLLANLINFLPITTTTIPALILALLSLHLLIAAYVVVKGSYLQSLKKCTERSEIVRRMFKEEKELTLEEQIDQQKTVVDVLMQKFNKLDISRQLRMTAPGPPLKEVAEEEEISDHEYIITEERILGEENKHLRYLEGMNFIEKYGNEVDDDIVKRHYAQI